MKKTVLVSAFHLIYISVLAKLLSFVVRILLARKLGSEAMSYYALASPTLVFLISVVQLGVPSALSKLAAARYPSQRPLFASALLTACTTALVLAVYVSILPYFATSVLKAPALRQVLWAITPMIPLVACSGLLKGYLFGIQHHYPANAAQLYEEGARIVFLLVFFTLHPVQDPIALAGVAMLSVSAGEAASVLYMLLHLRFSFHHIVVLPKALRQVRKSELGEVLSISMPMMGSRLSGSITYFLEPVLMLHFVHASQQAALVSAYGILNGYTLPLITMPGFLSVTLSNYLLPSFTYALAHRQRKNARRQCQLILGCCLGFGALCSLGCWLFYEPLFQAFYHTSEGCRQLQLLAVPFLFYPLQAPLSSLMHACSLSRFAFFDTLCGSLFRLGCVCLLSPLFAEYALLLALSGGMLITTFLHGWHLLRFYFGQYRPAYRTAAG